LRRRSIPHLKEAEMVSKRRHQAIVDAFSERLFASFTEAAQCYGKPRVVYPYPIFSIKTLPGYIFDDTFWDVFHAYPLHICHIAWLAEEAAFEIRFKVDETEENNG
jgi:hypothetical protein